MTLTLICLNRSRWETHIKSCTNANFAHSQANHHDITDDTYNKKQWCMYCSTCSKSFYEHSYLLHFCSWTNTKHVFDLGCPLNLCSWIKKHVSEVTCPINLCSWIKIKRVSELSRPLHLCCWSKKEHVSEHTYRLNFCRWPKQRDTNFTVFIIWICVLFLRFWTNLEVEKCNSANSAN